MFMQGLAARIRRIKLHIVIGKITAGRAGAIQIFPVALVRLTDVNNFIAIFSLGALCWLFLFQHHVRFERFKELIVKFEYLAFAADGLPCCSCGVMVNC